MHGAAPAPQLIGIHRRSLGEHVLRLETAHHLAARIVVDHKRARCPAARRQIGERAQLVIMDGRTLQHQQIQAESAHLVAEHRLFV
jgi:hypothetical protein